MDKTRTAAYCRVSTEYEEQDSSLEIQIEYFRMLDIDFHANECHQFCYTQT